MFKTIKFTFFLAFLLISNNISAENSVDMATHLKVMEITECIPPHFFKKNLVLTFKNQEKIRYVGVAFKHENYSKTYSFFKNRHGIFVLFYPLPKNKNNIYYRIIVDGLWISDPENPSFIMDNSGIKISRISNIPSIPDYEKKTPVIHDNNSVEFSISSLPGKRISIMGDFNNWDPYIHMLKEIQSGKYSIILHLSPGKHYYFYCIDGQKITDPNNSEFAYNDGRKVSKINIGDF